MNPSIAIDLFQRLVSIVKTNGSRTVLATILLAEGAWIAYVGGLYLHRVVIAKAGQEAASQLTPLNDVLSTELVDLASSVNADRGLLARYLTVKGKRVIRFQHVEQRDGLPPLGIISDYPIAVSSVSQKRYQTHVLRECYTVQTSAMPVTSSDRRSFESSGVKTATSCPLIAADGQLRGFVAAEWEKPQKPTLEDIAAIKFSTQKLAIAILP